MKRPMVRRIRRKLMGGRYDMRIYADGRMRVRVDHPSDDPAVEFAMVGVIASEARRFFADLGLGVAIGPVRWRSDP